MAERKTVRQQRDREPAISLDVNDIVQLHIHKNNIQGTDSPISYGNSLKPLQYGSTSESSLSLLSQEQPYKVSC